MSEETTEQTNERHIETEYARNLRQTIGFGLDVKAFTQSSVGRYLLAKANADRDTALEALADVDPEDPKAIRALQNRVKCAENFLMWLAEAATQGEIAEAEFITAD